MKAGIFFWPVFALFSAGSAIAGVSLPVVNTAAAGVSARAAFGEVPAKIEKKVAEVSAGKALKSQISNLKSAARSADVLAPSRPSQDLWARNANSAKTIPAEKPLRLPEPSEFAVLERENFALPEESLDYVWNSRAGTNDNSAYESQSELADVAGGQNSKPAAASRPSELDNQIARLIELQKKAEKSQKKESVARNQESVRVAAVNRAQAPSKIQSRTISYSPQKKKPAPVEEKAVLPAAEPSVRRVVVPMDDANDDVQVRAVQAQAADIRHQTSDFSYDGDVPFTKLSPAQLKKAFQKTYVSENKHLSTYKIDDAFDVASDIRTSMQGFDSSRDLSESDSGVRPLEIKISFRGDDSALSRDNFNLLSEYSGIVVSNAKRAVQVSIPEKATRSYEGRKLAAKRLAIVEQVLRDNGISAQRIMPVLSARDDDSFVLRVISNEQFQIMTQAKRDMFGDAISKKSYKSMSW